MDNSENNNNSILSDNQIIQNSLQFALKIYYPNRIPILDILEHKFNCDDKSQEIIKQQIIYHKIAKYADSKEVAIFLTIDGVKAIESGDAVAYMEKLKKDKNKPTISKDINIHAPITNSQIGHNSDFGNLESSHNSIILDTSKNVAVPKNEPKKTELSIWEKIYKWTDHKTISIIIGAILGVLATWICKKLGIFQF